MKWYPWGAQWELARHLSSGKTLLNSNLDGVNNAFSNVVSENPSNATGAEIIARFVAKSDASSNAVSDPQRLEELLAEEKTLQVRA